MSNGLPIFPVGIITSRYCKITVKVPKNLVCLKLIYNLLIALQERKGLLSQFLFLGLMEMVSNSVIMFAFICILTLHLVVMLGTTYSTRKLFPFCESINSSIFILTGFFPLMKLKRRKRLWTSTLTERQGGC